MGLNDKNIIKITSLVLFLALFYLFSELNQAKEQTFNKDFSQREWKLYKCVNGSIENFTKDTLFVCGGSNPYLYEQWIRERNTYDINLSLIIQNEQ